MKLTTSDMEWVKQRMDAYSIEYQEIYDELLDHILTAIEHSRAAGNTMNIEVLFQNVVNEHFADPENIEVVAIKGGVVYCKNLPKTYRRYIRQQFNWKTLVVAVIASAIAYQLPDIKPVRNVFLIVMFLLAVFPITYTYLSVGRKIKTISGKKSILRGTLLSQSSLPVSLLNLMIFLPRMFNDGKEGFLFNKLPPFGLMAILIFFLVLSISFFQLCNKVSYRNLTCNK